MLIFNRGSMGTDSMGVSDRVDTAGADQANSLIQIARPATPAHRRDNRPRHRPPQPPCSGDRLVQPLGIRPLPGSGRGLLHVKFSLH